ncbi:plastocyanin/azurin family copper-binding protein [Anderseniella sp. Alg231-50]|uniref:plastocyanin/azurin family copper-binding protein n=1 Tax=Anderseniella sp. Alg231-50 TaxID=1922226 RepID=UPI000D54CDFB
MKRRIFLNKAAAAIATAAFPALLFTWPGSAAAQARNHRVEISGFKFTPDRLEVSVGDTITWINRDIAPHTATASDASWDTGELVRDAEASIAVTAGMETSYFCAFHPMMKAQLSVTAPDQ